MPSETTGTSFPQEIIDLIIESIWLTNLLPCSDRDRSALKACTLVSRSFRESAQDALFTIITVTFPEPDPAADKPPARDPSAFTPRLRNFVNVLCLRYRSPCQIVNQNDYPIVNMYFPELCALLFEGYDELEWPSIPPWFRKRFYSMMQLPTLIHLKMDKIIGFPAAAFQPCNQLLQLMILSCTFSADTDADKECALTFSVSANSDKRGCLQSLGYVDWSSTISLLIDALSDPSSLLSVMHLQKLMATAFHDDSYTECQRILELTSPYLEDLGVWLGPFDSSRVLQFPRPEILRNVSLFCMTSAADIDHAVCHLSRLGTNHPNFTELEIHMNNMRLTSVRDSVPDMMAGFKLLDDKITSEPFATKLKLTRLVLHTDFEGKGDEEIPTILELIIPRFLSTRRVEIVDLSDPIKFYSSSVRSRCIMVNLYL